MPEGVGYDDAKKRELTNTQRIAKRKKGKTTAKNLSGQTRKAAEAMRKRQEMLKNI